MYDPFTVGELVLDRNRNEVQRNGQSPIRLTPLETRLLESIMLNVGQVMPAELLINAVWGIDGGDCAMLKQLVYRLRSKLEADPAQPRLLETVPGVGYALIEHA